MNLKPQQIVDKRINSIFAFVVFSGALLVYWLTLARSVSFWDCGEYITCSSILGVPHPPGNPFYIILGRFVSIFSPAMNHTIVINFLSAILSAFAVMFTYLFTVKIVSMFEKEKILIYLGGFLAASYTAFSATFWANSIEAEVYGGLAFIINLIVWLTFVWLEKSDNLSHQNLLILIVYIFFLGFGIHQTSLQIAPAVLIIALYPFLRDQIKKSAFWIKSVIILTLLVISHVVFTGIAKTINVPDLAKFVFTLISAAILMYYLRKHVSLRTWLIGLFLIIVAFSTHIFLFIRSEFRPFINEGNPHNFALFMDYFLRRQYGVTSFTIRRASFLYQLKDQFLTYFSWQFFEPSTISSWFHLPESMIRFFSNIFVSLLGIFGMYYHAKRNKHSFIYWLNFFFWSSLAMIFVINLSDKEVRTREYFFVTAYNFWTVWLAIGSIGIIRSFAKDTNKIAIYILVAIMLIFPALNLASQYFVHDRSREYIALDYGLNILNSVEEDAILFTNGDNDTFPLWYAQAVGDKAAFEKISPATNVIPTIKTKQIINQAYDFKDEQCGGVRKDVALANLSLLNTPWYIQQLRDREGIEFNWTNEQINKIAPSVATDASFKMEDILHWKVLLRILHKPNTAAQKELISIIEPEFISSLPYIDPTAEQKEMVLKKLNKLLRYQLNYNLFQNIRDEGYQIENGVYYLLQKYQDKVITKSEIKGLNNLLLTYTFSGAITNRKYIKIEGNEIAKSFTISFPKGKILMIKDISTIKLIKDNYGKRPIYFAVTVSDYCGFENHMKGEGMVERLVAESGSMNLNVEQLKKNIYKNYSYRGIKDSTIFKDKNMTRLLNNYGAPFMKLASYYKSKHEYKESLESMMKGLEFYSDKNSLTGSILSVGATAVQYAMQQDDYKSGYEYLEILYPVGKKDYNFISLIEYFKDASDMNSECDNLIDRVNKYQNKLHIEDE